MIPIRRRRAIPKSEVFAIFATAPVVDADELRGDLDEDVSQDLRDPYEGLQHVEATFDPLPYDQGAARLYGQICAAVRAAGRQPRKRSSDLQIAATAASNLLPLYTANPADFQGTEGLVEIVSVARDRRGHQEAGRRVG
jgi:predicted nucleic acid-binding protein